MTAKEPSLTQRIVSGQPLDEDATLDTTLRPKRLADFVGQPRIKDNLAIAIAAAKQRAEPLDHHLLYGPPGLGKTTLAHIIAHEMGVSIRLTSGPAIERPGARSIRLSTPAFTLVGATPRYAMLSPPLRDRFGAVYRLDFYQQEDMAILVRRNAALLQLPTEEDGALEIACRARGTPRVANRLLRRVRDYAQVMADGVVTRDVAREALARLEVDGLGPDAARPVGHSPRLPAPGPAAQGEVGIAAGEALGVGYSPRNP